MTDVADAVHRRDIGQCCDDSVTRWKRSVRATWTRSDDVPLCEGPLLRESSHDCMDAAAGGSTMMKM